MSTAFWGQINHPIGFYVEFRVCKGLWYVYICIYMYICICICDLYMSAAVTCTPPLRFLLKCSIYICNHHYIYRHHQSRCRIWWRFRFRAQTWAGSSPRVSFWMKTAFWCTRGASPLWECAKKYLWGYLLNQYFISQRCLTARAHTQRCRVCAPHLICWLRSRLGLSMYPHWQNDGFVTLLWLSHVDLAFGA